MTFPRTVEDEQSPSLLLRATSWFHKFEVAYVVVMTAVAFWGIVRYSRDLGGFTSVWGIAVLACAVLALWPRTPRVWHVVAEVVLLVVALGQVIGPRHDFLTFLNREIRNASKWNTMPLTPRRILVWNVVSAFGLIWGIPAVAILAGIVLGARRNPLAALGALLAFIIVWGGMGFLFLLVVAAFFQG